ncbi:hypothetical protein [Andreprevotia chitinilytica]|uniref:hypothetical protein n=1 Tax=Andreprevotia chitinilytica TaxID=396808 RepID=UPI001B80B683|nr:hypothetical protein [Andreprevotia chitinilytica]
MRTLNVIEVNAVSGGAITTSSVMDAIRALFGGSNGSSSGAGFTLGPTNAGEIGTGFGVVVAAVAVAAAAAAIWGGWSLFRRK